MFTFGLSLWVWRKCFSLKLNLEYLLKSVYMTPCTFVFIIPKQSLIQAAVGAALVNAGQSCYNQWLPCSIAMYNALPGVEVELR